MRPIVHRITILSTFDVQCNATNGNVRRKDRLKTQPKTPLDAYFLEKLNKLVEQLCRNLGEVFEKWINDSNGWNKYISLVFFQRKTPMNDTCDENRDQSLDHYETKEEKAVTGSRESLQYAGGTTMIAACYFWYFWFNWFIWFIGYI